MRKQSAKAISLLMTLGLLGGILTSSLIFTQPAAAAVRQQRATLAQSAATVTRLDVLQNSQGTIYDQWTYNSGTSWHAWAALAPAPNGAVFAGTPAVVSDLFGRLLVIARTNDGLLWVNATTNGAWSGWQAFPYQESNGNVSACSATLCADYVLTSDLVASSTCCGHSDLFVFGHSTGPNSPTVLLHFDTSGTGTGYPSWSGRWETLGSSGAFQGNPAAVSWSVGRIDVFARGGANELEHLWAEQPTGGVLTWHDWENLGGVITSSPTVASWGTGRLDVFARGSDGYLWNISFDGGWGAWGDLGCCLAGDVTNMVAATSQAPMTLDVFVLGTQHDLYRKAYNANKGGWTDWQYLDHAFTYTNIAAGVWAAPPPMALVPNVIGTDEDTAAATLTQAGFVVVYARQQDNSCRQPEFFIVTESPGPNTVQPVGSLITLLVSSGFDRAGNRCETNS